MSRQQCGDLWRFRGHKTQAVTTVANQKPPHRAVAQSAMAIENHQEPAAEFANSLTLNGMLAVHRFNWHVCVPLYWTHDECPGFNLQPRAVSGPSAARGALFPRRREFARAGLSRCGWSAAFYRAGQGAWITDVDGNRYIDYFGSWGPMILGHAFPPVVEAIERAARNSASFGASTAAEADLAERVVACYPAIEKMRFVSSGTEATMSAIRLARAATGRKMIVKFEGCYHGHADGLLVKAGSGVATFGIPGSAGVPEEIAHLTHALPYNDIAAVECGF